MVTRESLGDVTIEEYRSFTKRRGAAIEKFIKQRHKRLNAMDSEAAKEEISRKVSEITRNLKRRMRLEEARARSATLPH